MIVPYGKEVRQEQSLATESADHLLWRKSWPRNLPLYSYHSVKPIYRDGYFEVWHDEWNAGLMNDEGKLKTLWYEPTVMSRAFFFQKLVVVSVRFRPVNQGVKEHLFWFYHAENMANPGEFTVIELKPKSDVVKRILTGLKVHSKIL